MTHGALTLDLAREGRRLKISLFEGSDKALRPYVSQDATWDQIETHCRELLALLSRFNRNGALAAEHLNHLKKTGQVLFDLLIPPQIKEKLATSTATILTLRLEDNLVQIPWELLHDGQDFLCRRYATGRIASTSQTPTARSIREPKAPFSVLIIADPRGDLPAAYQEGLDLKAFLDGRRSRFHVDFKSKPVDIAFVKKNLRDYDIVHYAGHACNNAQNPSESGWLLSDGTLRAEEIAAMGGFEPMPALIFANGCESGQTDEWKNDGQEQPVFGLANAFLLSGVRHYIGTFREFADLSGEDFAKRFYSGIGNGETIGTALQKARLGQVNGSHSATFAWTNYMLYGDPAAHLEMAIGEEGQSGNARWKERLGSILSSGTRERTWLTPSLVLSAIALVALGYGGYSLLNLNSAKPVIPRAQVAVPSAMLQNAATQVPETLTLAMNIIGQRKEPDGRFSEVIVRDGSVLQSRDHFQVHVETNRRAHMYVLLFNSQGQASQLFPDPKMEQQGLIEAGRTIAVPDRELWFWLDDHPGTETVYVLASEEPLADIRLLLHKMEQANETERKKLSGEIKQQIEIVERGVGGVTKGKTVSYPLSDGRRVEKVTDVVAGTGAVVRTISFEHR